MDKCRGAMDGKERLSPHIITFSAEPSFQPIFCARSPTSLNPISPNILAASWFSNILFLSKIGVSGLLAFLVSRLRSNRSWSLFWVMVISPSAMADFVVLSAFLNFQRGLWLYIGVIITKSRFNLPLVNSIYFCSTIVLTLNLKKLFCDFRIF